MRMLLLLGTLVGVAYTSVEACRFTPLAWQQRVTDHPNPALKGQRKHTTWIRDQNRNFIDDEIEQRFKSGDHVNVTVDLNQCMNVTEIQGLLEPFGRIKYVVRMISSAQLLHVEVDRLPELAALPQVAMVEWSIPARPLLDASTRAVQSKRAPPSPAPRPKTWVCGVMV